MPEPSFTCPQCGATSHHPDDLAYGYCATCHAFTGGLTERLGGTIMSMAERLAHERTAAAARAAGVPMQWARLVRIETTSGTAESTGDDGTKTFRGFVTLEAKAEDGSVMAGQLDPDEVRDMALGFLSTAEAADQDALVFKVMTAKVGAPPEAVAQLVRDMRKERGQ